MVVGGIPQDLFDVVSFTAGVDDYQGDGVKQGGKQLRGREGGLVGGWGGRRGD